jgi:outer membrane protein
LQLFRLSYLVFVLPLFTPIVHAQDANGGASYVGGGVAYLPRYAGSKEYRVTPLVDASFTFRNGFFIDGAQGAGFRFRLTDQFFITTSAGLDPGRKDQNDVARPGSDLLKGMGDIKPSALANVGFGFKIGERADIGLMASKSMNHANYGMSYHLTGHVLAWSGEHDNIDLNAALHYGDDKYNQTYFGVTAVQAANTHFQKFLPGAGLNAAAGGVTWTHRFGEHWMTRVSAEGVRYLKDVADSPIVQKRTGYLASASIDYRF